MFSPATPSSQSADQAMCVWLSVTVLVEEVSVLGLSSAGSVLESAAAELLQSAARREWPVLIQQQGRPSTRPHRHTHTTRGAARRLFSLCQRLSSWCNCSLCQLRPRTLIT